jgi:hypothetical protein
MTTKKGETEPLDPNQITAKTLRDWHIEIISKCIEIWRVYRKEGKIFLRGYQLSDMICKALKLDPDIVEVEEIREAYKQLLLEKRIVERATAGVGGTMSTPITHSA